MYTCDVYRLVNDPEVISTKTGTQMTKFRVAYNQRARQGAEAVTWWVTVTIFGAQGQIAQNFLRKGSQVLLSGNLEMSKYQSTKTGTEETGYDLIVSGLTLVGNREEAQTQASAPARVPVGVGSRNKQLPVFEDDDTEIF